MVAGDTLICFLLVKFGQGSYAGKGGNKKFRTSLSAV